MRTEWEARGVGARHWSARLGRTADFFTAAALALETVWLIVFTAFYADWLLDGQPDFFSLDRNSPTPKMPLHEQVAWLGALTLLMVGLLLAAFAVLRRDPYSGASRLVLSSGLVIAILANAGLPLYLAYKQATYPGDLTPWILLLGFVGYMCVRCLLRQGSSKE
jgi:hypothetical protein